MQIFNFLNSFTFIHIGYQVHNKTDIPDGYCLLTVIFDELFSPSLTT